MTTRPLLANSTGPHDAEPVDELLELRRDLENLRQELGEFKTAVKALANDFDIDHRKMDALRAIFSGEVGPATQNIIGTNQKWEALKRAFPGRCSDLIDTLAHHGPLNTTAICTIMRSDPRTVAQLIYKLNKAGALEKNAGKFSLKP